MNNPADNRRRTATRPVSPSTARTRLATTRDLFGRYADRFLDLYLTWYDRAGLVTDLALVQQIAADVDRMCQDALADAALVEARSWRFRLTRAAGWLLPTSRWACTVGHFDDFTLMCQHARKTNGYDRATSYARRGLHSAVASEREAALDAVWFLYGWCIKWGAPR